MSQCSTAQPRRFRFAAAVGFAALACGGGTTDAGLDPEAPTPIVVNLLMSGNHVANDTTWYTLQLSGQSPFYAQLEVLSGSLTLTVYPETGSTAVLTLVGQAGVGLTTVGPHVIAGGLRARISGQGVFKFRILLGGSLPESISPIIAVNDTIEGESFESSFDLDAFTFTGTAGDELIGFAQGTTPGRPGVFAMTIEGPTGRIAVANGALGQDLQSFFTDGRFILPETATYTVRLSPLAAPIEYVGAYRFQLRRIQRKPETLPETPAVGQTLVEAMEHVGDVDEFRITGAPGEEYNVTIRAVAPGPPHQLAARILDLPVAGDEPLEVISTNQDSVITDRGTGRFALPASGSVKLQIEGYLISPYRGDYQVRVNRVDRRPETRLTPLVPSDSVLNERMDYAGDIDEFRLTLTSPDTLNVMVEIEPGSRYLQTGTLGVEVVPLGTPGPAAGNGPAPAAPNTLIHAPGLIMLGPGSYIVRIWGASRRVDTFVGKYGLYVYRIRRAVEGHSGVVAYGNTVSSNLNPIGDIDMYKFTGSKGDHIDLFFRTVSPGAQLGAALLVGPVTPLDWLRDPNAPIGEVHTGRVTLVTSGTFEISVAAGINWEGRGDYQFTLLRLTAEPEHHAKTIAVGAAVTDEAVDFAGDVDEFFLQDTPGKEFSIWVNTLPPPDAITLEIVDPVTKDVIDTALQSYQVPATLRHRIPASGKLLIRASGGASTGLYGFEVRPINRAPESVSAAVALGDTISGEAISPEADVDEFSFTANAGQRVIAYLHSPTAPTTFEGLLLDLVDPSGILLGSVTSSSVQPFGTFATFVITLPVSGQYQVRVSGNNQRGTQGAYRFLIQPQ